MGELEVQYGTLPRDQSAKRRVQRMTATPGLGDSGSLEDMKATVRILG